MNMNTTANKLDFDTSYGLGYNHGARDQREGLASNNERYDMLTTVDMRAYLAGYRNGAIAAYNSKG